MGRVRARGLAPVRVVATVALAAIALGACGTNVPSPRAIGRPSIGISVPLTNVACTTSNSCIAVGTSNTDVGPSSVGQYRKPSGAWAPIAVPSAPSSSLASSSCWRSACVFVGAQPSGDLAWLYDQTRHTVTSIAAPIGGRGIEAIDCTSSGSCWFIDAGRDGTARLFSADPSANSSLVAPPAPMTWVGPDHVSALACGSKFLCLVAVINSAHEAVIAATVDGGATWLPQRALPPTWTALTSLNCKARSCVALVATTGGVRIARTRNLGTTWKTVAVPDLATSMACAALTVCVVGGVRATSQPLLARYRNHVVTTVRTQYVPTPISDVACGPRICVAIGVTTVISLQP